MTDIKKPMTRTLAIEDDYRLVRVAKGMFEVRVALPILERFKGESEIQHAERSLAAWRHGPVKETGHLSM
jgi:hypothetical protein